MKRIKIIVKYVFKMTENKICTFLKFMNKIIN